MRRALVALLALVSIPGLLPAATIGTVVPILGQVADLVYDEQRQLVYLANATENRVEVYSVGGQRLLSSYNAGVAPASVAISLDRQTLYVANVTAATNGSVSVVDLNSGALRAEIPLGSRPDSLAVGADGQVVIIGSAGLLRLDPATRLVNPVPISPPPAPPPGLPVPGPTPTPAGFRARLATTPDGRLIFGLSANRLFVYEVASGAVLRSRTVGGLNAVLSASPDGSQFMAGPFLFDAETLTILGRGGLTAATLTGGSVFSPDGNTVYSSFSTQTPINPLNPNQLTSPVPPPPGSIRPPGPPTLGILQVLKANTRNLTPQLGLRLPDNIISKVIMSDNGQNLFAISQSGMLVVPIGRLNQFPILTVEADNVILSMDICNRNVQSVAVRVFNAGRGRLTYAAMASPANPNIVLDQATGIAPGNLQVSFSARGTLTPGTVNLSVVLVSPEAVNVEPAIRVSLNFRDVDQRGSIYPIQGVNSLTTGTITDMALDSARDRLYLSNMLLNQIEVFSISAGKFLLPIEVGAQPRSMALVGASLLVVANNAAENISVVDLDAMQEIDRITLGPVPLAAAPQFPASIAASNNAILFSTVPLAAAGATPGNGSIWQLSLATGTAFPRLNLGVLAPANSVDSRTVLAAPANGSSIVLVSGNGTVRLYDPATDNFPVTRTGAVTGLRGAVSAAPDGSFFVVDNTVFNSALAFQGTISNPTGTNVMSLAVAGNIPFRVRTGTTGPQGDPLQRLERLNLSGLQTTQSMRMVESVLPSPYAPRGQVQLLPSSMVLSGPNGSAFVLTATGLSVIPVSQPTGRGPTFNLNGVVNGASFRAPVAVGSIISIFGDELGDEAGATELPLPGALGGTCVTANDVAIPLFYVSPKQINAQLPANLTVGRVTLAVRSRNTGRTSQGVAVTLSATAPGIFTVTDTQGRKVAALFRAGDFSLVTPDNYAKRDEDLVLFATGLGRTNPAVNAGEAAPLANLALTVTPPQVCVGNHPHIVTFSGLAPGWVGLYQVNIRVPGDRVQGDRLPVVITMGTDCRNASTQGAPTTSIH